MATFVPIADVTNRDRVTTRDRSPIGVGAIVGPKADGAGPSAPVAVSDHDYGDLTVSAGGTIWTINNLAVTNAKISSVAWAKVTATPTTLAGYGITDAASSADVTAVQDNLDILGASLSAVAFTGSYSDLLGLPSFAAVAFSGDAADLTGLATVATTGAALDVVFSSFTGLTSTDVSNALDELHGLITGGGGTVADGDYGDITVSSSGSVWTIDAATVTPAKITNRAALSVFGRSANSSGVGADIAAGTDGHVLRRSGTTLGFGTIGDASISALAFSKLTALPTTLAGHGITDAITAAAAAAAYQPLDPDLSAIAALTTAAFGRSLLTLATAPLTGSGFTMTTARLLGRTTAATGAVEELTAGTSLSLGSGSLNTIQDIRTTASPQWTKLGVGTAPTNVTWNAAAPKLQLVSQGAGDGFGLWQYSADNIAPAFIFVKGRSGTIGDNTAAVQVGDVLGQFAWGGTDGANVLRAGRVYCIAETVASGNINGSMVLAVAKSNAFIDALTLAASGAATFSNSIKTANPSGGTAQGFKSGSYVGGAPAATGYVQFEVNGTAYKLLCST